MNVLFLSELFYPHGGGAELATYLYAMHIRKLGFKVITVTNRFPGESEFTKSENFTIYRLPLLKQGGSLKYSTLQRLDILFAAFMRKLMKWADVVYIPRRWFSAVPLAKTYRKPVVMHIHDYIPICPLATLYDSAEKRICQRSRFCSAHCIYFFERKKRKLTSATTSVLLNVLAKPVLKKIVELSDAIICVSKVQRNTLVNYVPSIRDKTQVIYNPIPYLSSLDINGDDFGYFGGLNYSKGFHVLYNAMASIKDANRKKIRIHATKFPVISEKCKNLFYDKGIIPYGKLGQQKYNNVYRSIRAVIVPSVWIEPWGYVITEAILRGRLVIASRIGGIPEQVEVCRGVFLFTPGNYKQLAETIKYVKDLDGERVISLSMQNKESFLRKFSNERTIKDFVRLLSTVSLR